MRTGLRWVLFAAVSVTVQSAGWSAPCRAATFLDWVHGRTPSYSPCESCGDHSANYAQAAPAPIAYPATTSSAMAYAPTTSAPMAYAPTTSAPLSYDPSASAGYAATTSAACDCGSTQPTTVTYAPEQTVMPYAAPQAPQRNCLFNWQPTVRYKTSWVRVPVTYYRPTTAVDPATGCPTTSLQACSSYQWQVQQRPTVRYWPSFSGFRWPWCNSQTPATAPPAAAVPYDPCAPTMTQPYAQPYMQSPGLPAGSPYYSTTPGAMVMPGPAGTPGTAPSPVPADNPPTLQPGTVQPGPLQSTPQSSSYRGLAPAESSDTPDNSGIAPLEPPAINTGASATEEPRRLESDMIRQPTYVKPIPDPESSSTEPPQLLNPRDRTAAVDTRAVRAVSWPDAPRREHQAPAAPAKVRWDDSGWQSARSN